MPSVSKHSEKNLEGRREKKETEKPSLGLGAKLLQKTPWLGFKSAFENFLLS